MELGSRDFRAMMWYDFLSGKSPHQCLENLAYCFGKQAPSRSTVFKWYGEFRAGRRSLNDDVRCGAPATAVTPENVIRARQLIKENPRITYVELQHSLGVLSGSVNTILHEHLQVRKRCARWVPQNLSDEQKATRVEWCQYMLQKFDGGRSRRVWDIVTGDETWLYCFDPETKQQSSVWVFPDEDPPVKFKRSRSSSKQMVASFFTKTGHLITVPLEERKTVTSDWYVTNCLPKVMEAWCQRRPRTATRVMLLHHDNAPAHTATRTLEFLDENGIQLVTHPPYSPDLAPCDWFLFPFVKK